MKSRMTLEVPSGESWSLEGSFIEKNYSVTVAGRPIVQISQKWVTVRDTYTLDVADGVDPRHSARRSVVGRPVGGKD